MFEPTGAVFWMTLLSGVAIYLVFSFMRGGARPSDDSGGNSRNRGRGGARRKRKEREDDSESDFSDEPSSPVHMDAADAAIAAIEDAPRIPLKYTVVEESDMIQRAAEFYKLMNSRRTVREFSSRDVPFSVIEDIIRTAGTSPSGAHTQPWTYVVVRDPEVKAAVRQIVEREEELNYDRRMGDQWVRDLSILGTDHEKAYLEAAPYLIIAFEQTSGRKPDGGKQLHYYSRLSCAISSGLLLAAIHNAGRHGGHSQCR